MEKVERAIILAAGEGKRLRPITLKTPKPLVCVNGVRLIDTSINALKKNGIHEIYIVTGYKKEQFYETYEHDSDIHIIENPYYEKGNNITSMYFVRDVIPGSFILEGDFYVNNEKIFNPDVQVSGYCATRMEKVPEWMLKVENDRIVSCEISGGENGYRLWGASMWTKKDGIMLSELIKRQIEEKKDWSIYWDEIALDLKKECFNLGVRNIGINDITEIDTLEELATIDSEYSSYLRG